jgi:hypothetical protein
MSNINPLNPSDTFLDLSKPLPPRTKCAPGSEWFYTDIQYAKLQGPNGVMLISECSTLKDIEFDHNTPNGILLPNGTSSDLCAASKQGDIYSKFKKFMSENKQSTYIPYVYSMPTGCLPERPNPLCDSNNQVYDSQFQVCVSCRDPIVKPTINNSTPSTFNYVDNSISSNTIYQCKNKPNLSMDLSGKVISKTCDSGETLSNGVCIINFNATQN